MVEHIQSDVIIKRYHWITTVEILSSTATRCMTNCTQLTVKDAQSIASSANVTFYSCKESKHAHHALHRTEYFMHDTFRKASAANSRVQSQLACKLLVIRHNSMHLKPQLHSIWSRLSLNNIPIIYCIVRIHCLLKQDRLWLHNSCEMCTATPAKSYQNAIYWMLLTRNCSFVWSKYLLCKHQ